MCSVVEPKEANVSCEDSLHVTWCYRGGVMCNGGGDMCSGV